MKKLINEAFRMQQLAGIEPLYENYYGDSYGTNYSGATARVDVYLSDIEINGVVYSEIELTLNAKSSDESGQNADWEIRSVDGATLENGEKINDRKQLQTLIPSILDSEEASSQIQNSLDSGFEWDGFDEGTKKIEGLVKETSIENLGPDLEQAMFLIQKYWDFIKNDAGMEGSELAAEKKAILAHIHELLDY